VEVGWEGEVGVRDCFVEIGEVGGVDGAEGEVGAETV